MSSGPPARAAGPDARKLHRLATAIRLRAVRMVAPQGFGYLGQALSAAEQYAAVYGAAPRPGTDRWSAPPATTWSPRMRRQRRPG